MNRRVIATWSRILSSVENSRLLISSAPGPAHAEFVRLQFAAHGVDPRRIETLPLEPYPKFLERLSRMDFSLDTFPVCGGVTNATALWMGVPYVTLEGDTEWGRYGASLLRRCGLGELVARTPDEYVRLAVEWVRHPRQMADVRSQLRERMREDVDRIVAGIEAAYRQAARAKGLEITSPV